MSNWGNFPITFGADFLEQDVAGYAACQGTLSILYIRGGALSGTLTPTGALAAFARHFQSASGALTPSGTLDRLITCDPSGTLPSIGELQQQTKINDLAGALATSGVLASVAKYFHTPSGAVIPSSSLDLKSYHNFIGAMPPASGLTSQGNTLPPMGLLAILPIKPLSGSLVSAGALTMLVKPSLSGGITPAGDASRMSAISLSGNVATSGLGEYAGEPLDVATSISTPLTVSSLLTTQLATSASTATSLSIASSSEGGNTP